MKRFLFLTLTFLFSTISYAQTQQGIVKTRGRMVNGQLLSGQRLTGATVTLSFGNPLVSGNNGAFSFNVPTGKNYSLVAAKKQGYTLADPEYTRRSFAYSGSNPFYVVLEDENQRQADINAATRKLRRTLTTQLQAREDEIETLKAQNKITEKEYQERLKQLYDSQSKTDSLVQVMAERYATTDYDQLDEFNRQVQMYIEEGELQKADSMIRSKGDIEKRVAEYHNVVAANKEVRKKLEQSETATAKTYEDLSQDLYRKAEIYKQEHRYDSASHCLKMRANMDTTNVYAVWDYARDCSSWWSSQYTESQRYYKIALRRIEQLFMQAPNKYRSSLAGIQEGLAGTYKLLHDTLNCEKYYLLALENYEYLFNQNEGKYRASLARTQDWLGELYRGIDKSKYEKFSRLALENYIKLFDENPDKYANHVFGEANWLGNYYFENHDLLGCLKCVKYQVEIAEYQFTKDPNYDNTYDLAWSRGYLGLVFSQLGDSLNAEKYAKLSLENSEACYKIDLNESISHNNIVYSCINDALQILVDLYSGQNTWETGSEQFDDKILKQIYKDNPNGYHFYLALKFNDLGERYKNDYIKSEEYYKKALENCELLFEQDADAYRRLLIWMQKNIGDLYLSVNNYESSEKYYRLSVENCEYLFKQDPKVYRADLANAQNSLGYLYWNLRDYANSEKYFKLSLENMEQLFQKDSVAYRMILSAFQDDLGRLYNDVIHDYEKSKKYFKQALANREILFSQDPELYRVHIAWTQNNLGKAYSNLHDYANSEKYYMLALENRELLYKQDATMYRDILAETRWNMMVNYGETNRLEEYDDMLERTLMLYRKLNEENPEKYKPWLIASQNRKVLRLLANSNVDEALTLAQETYILDDKNEALKMNLAECYNSKAYEYAKVSDFTNAYASIDKAISMIPGNANFYDSKGEILLMQGKKEEALAMWKKVLELNPDFLKDYPDATELSNGLKKLGLIK